MIVWLLVIILDGYLDYSWQWPPDYTEADKTWWRWTTFEKYEMCMDGPEISTWCYCETHFDMDEDGDVDLKDFGRMRNAS